MKLHYPFIIILLLRFLFSNGQVQHGISATQGFDILLHNTSDFRPEYLQSNTLEWQMHVNNKHVYIFRLLHQINHEKNDYTVNDWRPTDGGNPSDDPSIPQRDFRTLSSLYNSGLGFAYRYYTAEKSVNSLFFQANGDVMHIYGERGKKHPIIFQQNISSDFVCYRFGVHIGYSLAIKTGTTNAKGWFIDILSGITYLEASYYSPNIFAGIQAGITYRF